MRQNMCTATLVLKRYSVSSSLPDSKRKADCGTTKCVLRFILQIEQLQSQTKRWGDASAVKRTAPQWHCPSCVTTSSAILRATSCARTRAAAGTTILRRFTHAVPEVWPLSTFHTQIGAVYSRLRVPPLMAGIGDTLPRSHTFLPCSFPPRVRAWMHPRCHG